MSKPRDVHLEPMSASAFPTPSRAFPLGSNRCAGGSQFEPIEDVWVRLAGCGTTVLKRRIVSGPQIEKIFSLCARCLRQESFPHLRFVLEELGEIEMLLDSMFISAGQTVVRIRGLCGLKKGGGEKSAFRVAIDYDVRRRSGEAVFMPFAV